MRALLVLLASLAAPEGEPERPGVELIEAQVRALELAPLGPGADAELSLVVLEAPDRDMPLTVRLDGGAVELLDDRLDWGDVVDPLALQPRVSVPFRAPAEPGEHEVRALVDYSVCGPRWCRTKRGELRWTIVVEDATDETGPS